MLLNQYIQKKYNWEFIFLGADIDAWGAEIGISFNVNIEKSNLSRSFKGLSHHVLGSRLGKFFEESDSFNLSEDELDKRLNAFGDDEDIQ